MHQHNPKELFNVVHLVKLARCLDQGFSVRAAQVDPAEWRLEVERVAPRLKITVASSTRDWRSHLDEAHKFSAEISSVWPDTQAALGAVQTEVTCMLAAAFATCILICLHGVMSTHCIWCLDL